MTALAGVPKIVHTAEGPALQVPTAGDTAVRLAGLISTVLSRPEVRNDDRYRELRALRDRLADAQVARDAGRGFTAEPLPTPSGTRWVSPREMANVTGVARQTITKRCRSGELPGAQCVDGHWIIPLPADLDEDPTP